MRAKESVCMAAMVVVTFAANAHADDGAYAIGPLDVATVLAAVPFAVSTQFRTQPAWCAPKCDPSSLDALDRATAGVWRPGWSTATDVGVATLGVGAVTVLFADERLGAAWKDAFVVGEATLLASALRAPITLAVSRPRPYMYGESAPLSQRTSADGALSFVSSHSATSFALVVATAITARRVSADSPLWAWTLGLGLAGASFVATGRVLAGRHFPSDVLLGAAFGSAVGVAVPALHDAPVKVVPAVGGVALVGAL